MPIGMREMYLVLRAEDFASSTLSRVGGSVAALGSGSELTGKQVSGIGSAMVAFGTGLALVGAVGLKVFYDATKVASEYSLQAAYAKTQTQGLGITLQQLEQVGLDVATKIPVPLKDVQQALYDIFSSLDVNLPQAKMLLTDFSKAAVAGQTSLEIAGRGTMQMMNAFKIPVSGVTGLLDLQFQMVKYGVGTYDQFIGHLGSIVPVSVASGQALNTMAGSWAFATREGMTVAGAATSVSRAMESMQKAAFQSGLQKLGIDALDSSGHLKQINQLVTDIATNPGWQQQVKQSGSVSQAYIDTFGQGTIQARRFFDVALPNYKDLNAMVAHMSDSKGQMQQAYDTMFNQPANQAILFKNNVQALQIQMGNVFLPIINKVIEAGTKLMQWFEHLSPSTRKLMVEILLGVSAFALLVGGIFIVGGGFVMLVGAIMALGVGFGLAVAIIGAVVATIAVLAAAVFFAIKYHKDLAQWGKDAWHIVQNAVKEAIKWIEGLAEPLKILIGIVAVVAFPILLVIGAIILVIKYHKDLMQWAKDAWQAIKDAAMSVAHVIGDVAHAIMLPILSVVAWFRQTWTAIMNWWHQYWPEMAYIVREVWVIISSVIKLAWDVIGPIINIGLHYILDLFTLVWDLVSGVVKIAWNLIVNIIKLAWAVLLPMIRTALDLITAIFKIAWNVIGLVVKVAFDLIMTIIKVAWDIIKGIFQVALDLLSGNWSKAWHDISKTVIDILNAISAFITQTFHAIVNFAIQLFHDIYNAMVQVGHGIIQGAIDGITALWHLITDFFSKVFSVIIGFFKDAGTWLFDVGKNIIQGLINGITNLAGAVGSAVVGVAKGAVHAVTSFLGIGSPSRLFHDMGNNMTQGLINGINQQKSAAAQAATDLVHVAGLNINKGNIGLTSTIATAVQANRNTGQVIQIPRGAIQINFPAGTSTMPQQQAWQDAMDQGMEKFAAILTEKLNSTRAA